MQKIVNQRTKIKSELFLLEYFFIEIIHIFKPCDASVPITGTSFYRPRRMDYMEGTSINAVI